jgi:caffeoyl-CoA O-methyltransferase
MTEMPHAYIRHLIGNKDPVMRQILESSLLEARMPPIQIDDNAGRILQLITLIKRPRRVLEIGTLFGYSTIYIARGLPEGGTVTTLELDAAAAEVAARNFAHAGVSEKIEIIVGDAISYLQNAAPQAFDMIFVDAEKSAYLDYLKLCYPLLATEGVILADDAFGWGHIADASIDDPRLEAEVKGTRAYNQVVAASRNLITAFIGTENGIAISLKTAEAK